ncbi:MAG: hypothetical protein ACLR2G_07630 [Phascolarctobacterium faecium]
MANRQKFWGYAGHIIAARQGKLLATSFHLELTDSDAVYRYFLQL